MAKTIKFNLICDDKPVRTVEDLQNNFSIEDVLTYYNNRLLHRWLEVRGYTEELKEVNGITAKKSIEIIKELIKIFCVVCDEKKVEESVYMLEYLDERQVLFSEYDKENYKAEQIIDDYQTGYRQLVDGILENSNDAAKIKANIAQILKDYKWVFELNYRELFWMLKDKSPLAIMCFLMNENSRHFYLPVEKFSLNNANLKMETAYEAYEEMRADKCAMFSAIYEMIDSAEIKNILGDNLISFSGITDGYWKDLEPKGKKYMIISMGIGDFVRSAGLSGGDLGSKDIENKFVIVDGIDYKSNSADSRLHQLRYMEV